jgi:hypothetical protein
MSLLLEVDRREEGGGEFREVAESRRSFWGIVSS